MSRLIDNSSQTLEQALKNSLHYLRSGWKNAPKAYAINKIDMAVKYSLSTFYTSYRKDS